MDAPEKSRNWLVSLAKLISPAVATFLFCRLGGAHSSGTLLLLCEPLLLAIGLYLAAAFVMRRQWRASVATVLAIGIGAISLHLPVTLPKEVATREMPHWLRLLRNCAVLSKGMEAPIRLVTWTLDENTPMADTIARIQAQRPDLVVLLGTDDQDVGSALSEVLDGEVKFFPDGGGVTAIVRGDFQYCAEKKDSWSFNLPALTDGDAQVIMTFPYIKNAGTLPLMIVRMDTPDGPTDLPAWSQRLAKSAAEVASAARLVGTPRMIVVGNFQAPVAAQPMALPLRSSGLKPVATPPNWPTRIGGIPMLTVHALDQLWAGRDWHAQRARVLPSGDQVRQPLIVDLTPVEAHAR